MVLARLRMIRVDNNPVIPIVARMSVFREGNVYIVKKNKGIVNNINRKKVILIYANSRP